MPPRSVFGQLRFSSTPLKPSTPSRRLATSAYSGAEKPMMLTTTGTRQVAQESGDTDVLQPDRVEHAARRLGDADGRVAAPRPQRRRLRDDGAQALDVEDLGELDAVAEGAGGDHPRVRQD